MSEGKSRLCVSCRKSIDEFIGTHTGRAGWQVKATREGWKSPEDMRDKVREALIESQAEHPNIPLVHINAILNKLVPETRQEGEKE